MPEAWPKGKSTTASIHFPAFVAQCLGFTRELRGHKPIQQRRILQPAALIILEQVAGNEASARHLVNVKTDKLLPLIAGAGPRLRWAFAANNPRGPYCKNAPAASQTCSWRAW